MHFQLIFSHQFNIAIKGGCEKMVKNIQATLNKLSPQLGGIMCGCCQHLQHNFTQCYIQGTSHG
jgi:hypothetical protein